MKTIIQSQSGQGLTEYLILLILISVACIASVHTLGNTVKDKLQRAREKINSVSVSGTGINNGDLKSKLESKAEDAVDSVLDRLF